MKVVIVLVAVFALFGAVFASAEEQKLQLDAVQYQTRLFEDLINSTINSIVAVVARYDPVSIEHQEQDLLGHHGEIHNLQAEGFSNVVATHIKLSGLITWTLELETVAPKIVGSVEHWKVDGELFYGNGSARVEINDLKVKVKAKINPITMNIKDLLITPSIGHADVSITGIYNDEELSKKISDNLNVFLNEVINNDQDLHKRLSEIALEYIQKILDLVLG